LSKTIEVFSKGKRYEVIVDDDFDLPNKIFVSQGYAWINRDGKTEKLHRVIMGAKTGELVDHINGNGLDNRKSNLRFATKSQNGANSKRKGYSFHKASGKWRATITKNYKQYTLGYFDTEEEARKAYKKAHAEIFGEFSPYYKELMNNGI
jgi:HNH endonuclease/AP2 domain